MKEIVIAICCPDSEKAGVEKMIDAHKLAFSFAKRIYFEDGIFNLKLKKSAGPLEWFLILHAIHESYPDATNVVDVRTGIDQLKRWNDAGVKAKEMFDAMNKADV